MEDASNAAWDVCHLCSRCYSVSYSRTSFARVGTYWPKTSEAVTKCHIGITKDEAGSDYVITTISSPNIKGTTSPQVVAVHPYSDENDRMDSHKHR